MKTLIVLALAIALLPGAILANQQMQVQGAVVQHLVDIDKTVAEVCNINGVTQVTINAIVYTCEPV